MLEQKQADLTGKVVTLLFLSGQEILGKLVNRTNTEVTINKARAASQSIDQATQKPVPGKILFVPIMATGDPEENITFERDKILAIGVTFSELAKDYEKSISEVITTEKSRLIT